MKKIFAALMAMIMTVGIASAAYAGMDQETYLQIDEYLQRELKKANIPGMAMAIVDKNEVLFSSVYGNCERIDTPFIIGSMSKSFTALAVMQLAEQGKINLDGHISEYLSGLSAGGEVTVRQLLNQTSGFSMYQTLKNLKITDSHGTHLYANVNYGLLGEIIEAVSGISYGEYIQKNIYEPIGMNHSYTTLEDGKTGGLIDGYRNYFGFPVPQEVVPDRPDWSSASAGYLISSASDMGKYLQMYLNDGDVVVSSDTVNTVFYDNVPEGQSGDYYGMGWTLSDKYAEPVLMHGGNVENYISNMFILPESGVGVVMLVNTNDYLVANGMMGIIGINIISKIIGAPPKGTPPMEADMSYLTAHLLIDLIYMAIFLISFLPLFFIKERGKRKKKIRALVTDGFLHIAYPSFLLLIPSLMGVPFFVIRGFVPDLFWVLTVSAVLAYSIGIIKTVLLMRSTREIKIISA